MGEWIKTTLGELAEVYDGPHATPRKTESGPWFLSISSLDRGRLKLSESAHLSDEDFVRWTRRVTPQEGDVLFSYETRLGDAALMPNGIRACLGRRMGLLRPRTDKVDSRFLLYTYLAPQFQQTIQVRRIHGATVDRIPLVEFPTWPITVPPLAEQQAIAATLGAIDDKISVNDRIELTTEQLLGARFEELGIDVEPNGKVPLVASDLVEFNPRVKAPSSDMAAYLDMAALPTSTARVRAWSRRPPKSGTRFSNGDTVMARITPCLENGKTGFVDFMDDNEVGVGSTEFIVMRARGGVPVQVPYFLARSPRFRSIAIQNMVGSSGRQRVSAARLESVPLTKPDESALKAFGEAASKAFAHMKSLGHESRVLAQLRDTLLPKLMSGELRVRDAERVLEDAT